MLRKTKADIGKSPHQLFVLVCVSEIVAAVYQIIICYFTAHEHSRNAGSYVGQDVLYDAFSATCEKRKTIFSKDNIEATLHLISDDLQMAELWAQFQKSNFYVGDLAWKNVIGYVENTMKKYLL
jgi:hypothetical protein